MIRSAIENVAAQSIETDLKVIQILKMRNKTSASLLRFVLKSPGKEFQTAARRRQKETVGKRKFTSPKKLNFDLRSFVNLD